MYAGVIVYISREEAILETRLRITVKYSKMNTNLGAWHGCCCFQIRLNRSKRSHNNNALLLFRRWYQKVTFSAFDLLNACLSGHICIHMS